MLQSVWASWFLLWEVWQICHHQSEDPAKRRRLLALTENCRVRKLDLARGRWFLLQRGDFRLRDRRRRHRRLPAGEPPFRRPERHGAAARGGREGRLAVDPYSRR